MSQSDDRALALLLQHFKSEPPPHPPSHQLVDYYLGYPPSQEIRRIRAHLSLCSECTQFVLDLVRFERGELEANSDITAADLSDTWRLFRKQLKAMESSTTVSFAVRKRSRAGRTVPGWYQGLAAMLGALALGLGIWAFELRQDLSVLTQPQVNVAFHDLVIDGVRSTSTLNIVRIRPDQTNIVLHLVTYPEGREEYDFTIENQYGEIISRGSGLRHDDNSDQRPVILSLRSDQFPDGDYLITLLPANEHNGQSIAFRWTLERDGTSKPSLGKP